MNADQVRTILRAVANLCPAQKFDEFTPDMWLAVLTHTNFDDAKTAVISLGRQQAFIAPGEIHAEVRRMRAARIDRLPQPCPNQVDGVDPRDELLAIRAAIADGQITTTGQIYAYERWGGSLHLARLTGRVPALDGPEPGNRPIEFGPVFPAVPPR